MQAFHRTLPLWARITLLIGLLGVAASTLLISYRYYRRPIVLTLAVGSSDGAASQIASIVAGRLATTNSPVRLKVENSGSALDAAKALAAGKVDLAMVRADVGDLHEARAIALTGRGVLTIVAPPGSPISTIAGLRGHAVGVADGQVNRGIVENLRKEYDLDRTNVVFKDVTAMDARRALQSKEVSALLLVAPLTERHLAWIKGLFRESAGALPVPIPVDAAGAIAERKGPYDSFDIPKGTLRGAPPVPDDDLTTLRVGYYLVANRHLNANVMADLARKVMSVRRDLVGEQPLLSGVAAPDLDADAFLPAHPGAAAFFNGTQESFFDRYSNLIYMTPMVLGALASLFAAAWRFLGMRADDAPAAPLELLCDLSARIRRADDEAALAALEAEIDRMLRAGLANGAGEGESVSLAAASISAAHRLDGLIHHRRIILAFERMADPAAGLSDLFAGGSAGMAPAGSGPAG
jgi:TRAP-type uncharacterized transport system substrate-binding protein